jgi:glycosyltransferase involved in cell wall biosynthesis
MNKKLKILVLSSLSPYKSANFGLDVIKSLELAGHEVDFLTKYQFDGMTSNMFSVFDYSESESVSNKTFIQKLKEKVPLLRFIHNPTFYFRFFKQTNQTITISDELQPCVDSELILNKINKKHDLVITVFWWFMITGKTLRDIYEKLSCPILIYSVDMAPLTGGCYYFWNCRKFLNSCGNCPALWLSMKEDKTNSNFLYKIDVYKTSKCMFLGNTWQCNWAKKSPLFDKEYIRKLPFVLDENVFLTKYQEESRKLLQITQSKKFILFAATANLLSKRKGGKYLISAVNRFILNLTPSERKDVLLIIAGNNGDRVQKYFKIDVHSMGFLDIDKLVLAYSAADCFLCSSIEDAGPSMINQSLMCGTPVIAFETGVALDLVHTGFTGYRANYKDVEDFAHGIKVLYRQNASEKNLMRENCRTLAVQECSLSAFSQRIENIYNEIVVDESKK